MPRTGRIAQPSWRGKRACRSAAWITTCVFFRSAVSPNRLSGQRSATQLRQRVTRTAWLAHTKLSESDLGVNPSGWADTKLRPYSFEY